MLQTQVFQSFTQRPSKALLKFGALATTIGGGYGAFWHWSRKEQLEVKFNKVDETITEWKPFNVECIDAVQYPWSFGQISEWEYKLVKLYGYFRVYIISLSKTKEERIFIKRQKDHKDGYLVFAPFITSSKSIDHILESNQIRQSQVMVNLGWVPVENKSEIEMGNEPLGTYEEEEGQLFENADFNTGFRKNISQIEDDDKQPFVEFVGLVRRGESQNILKGRRNWVKDGVNNYIDLWYMNRLFRSQNLTASSTAYIERVVQELDEESESIFPIPATVNTWVKDDLNPKQHENYAFLFAMTGALSLGLLALKK